MRTNRLTSIIASGGCAFGPNLQIPSPWLVEIVALAGFDYVMLDGEHGGVFEDLANLILAADAADITPIVRVPSHERGWLVRALEYGAGAVQVPMVETAEQAKRLVAEVKYAPLGRRGFSNVSRAARFGAVSATDQVEKGNSESLLVLQLESREAVANAQEIAGVPGIDLLFIGPGDLSQSLGFPGQPKAPEVIEAMKSIITDVDERVPIATSAFSGDDVRMWRSLGVRCFLTSSTHPIRRALESVHSELVQGLDNATAP